MLLKKNVNGDVVKSFYDSSNLMVSEYNQRDKNLLITFKNGGAYLYKGVTATDYSRFEMAESQGSALNKTIKPKYDFEKVDAVDVEVIQEEIKQIKLDELKEYQGIIISAFKGMSDDWDNKNNGFDNIKLKRIIGFINTYETKSE